MHGVDHPIWCWNSISNLCVKISSLILILILIFLDIMLRAIHSISPYHSMILIPGWRPHQFMFLIALRLVKLWMPSFRYSFKIIFIECYIRKLQIYRFWFFNFFSYLDCEFLLLDLLLISFMNGMLLTPMGHQGIALCLQHVKRTRLCPRV